MGRVYNYSIIYFSDEEKSAMHATQSIKPDVFPLPSCERLSTSVVIQHVRHEAHDGREQ